MTPSALLILGHHLRPANVRRQTSERRPVPEGSQNEEYAERKLSRGSRCLQRLSYVQRSSHGELLDEFWPFCRIHLIFPVGDEFEFRLHTGRRGDALG